MRVWLFVVLLGLVSGATFAAKPVSRIGQQGRWLMDQQGRVLTSRGIETRWAGFY